MMRLYHFTCDHHAAAILAARQLHPNHSPVLGAALIWLTPFAGATAAELGLAGRTLLRCDRMAHRFAVDTDVAEPWTVARASFDSRRVLLLESAPGTKPAHWYVARASLAITPVSARFR